MKWPTGKYNGKKISGFRVLLQVRLLSFFWTPRFEWNFGQPHITWLIFTIRFEAEYK